MLSLCSAIPSTTSRPRYRTRKASLSAMTERQCVACGLIWTTDIYNGADCLECGGVWRNVKKNKVEEEKKELEEKEEEKKEEEKKKELEEKKREIMIQIFQQMVETKKLQKERLEIHRKWFNDDESETEDAGGSSSSALR